jgi:predicted PurR-regulated permease PerM
VASGSDGPRDRPPDGRTSDQIAIDRAIRLGFLALFAYISLRLLQPFLPILLWSVVLTVSFHPVFAWLRDRLGGRSSLAAGLVTLGILAVVLGPAAMLAANLVRSAEALAPLASVGTLKLPPPPSSLAELPRYGEDIVAAWNLASANLEAFLSRFSGILIAVGEWLLHRVAGLTESAVHILLAVLVSGFLYAPAPRLVSGIRMFGARILGPHGAGFADLAGATIRSVARGVIGVAIIQALLIGVGLIAAGVPAAGLLTLAALVLGIIQIGSAPVVVPVLVWAWFSMSTGPALLLTLYLIPATLIDNVLKPMLLGKGLETPTLVILAGVIGGTLSYGLIGLFLGPIVLAVFYDLVVFWVLLGTPAEGDQAAPRPGGIE